MANRNRKKTTSVEVVESVEKELYENVRSILAKARATVYVAANTAMVEAYWNVGRLIVQKQGGASRASYGNGLIDALAKKLTVEFGPGFTRSNLRNMRQFYLMFPIRHTVCGKLTWSHFRVLITVANDAAREYYFNECIQSRWSVRVLQRQIDTQFYERLIRNHSPVISSKKVVKRGAPDPRDLIRSPAILEFVGMDAPQYKEKDLESALIKNMRMFLMELGRGFCLEAEQKRHTAAILSSTTTLPAASFS